MVLQQPVGIAVLVTPWNLPVAMATRKAGPVFGLGTMSQRNASDIGPTG